MSGVRFFQESIDSDSIVTVGDIVSGLERLDIRRFDAVIVHASLSSFGWVCGGAQAVVQALLSPKLSGVTFVFPTFSGDWTDPAGWKAPVIPLASIDRVRASIPPFDRALTPTRGMGSVAECFRTHLNSQRSSHPQVSFTAIGPQAVALTRSHSLGDRFGEVSPLGALDRINSGILFLGTDFRKCTALHLAEYRVNYPARKLVNRLVPVYSKGVTTWSSVRDIALIEDDFPEIGDRCAINIENSITMIGRSNCRLVSFTDVVKQAQMVMERRSITSPKIIR